METTTNHRHKHDVKTAPHTDWPAWWSNENTTAWERAKEGMRRDWQQTKQAFDKENGQGKGRKSVGAIPVEPEDFEACEPALRYGYAASLHYDTVIVWDDALEAKLRAEWMEQKPPRTWNEAKGDVKHAWASARSAEKKIELHQERRVARDLSWCSRPGDGMTTSF